MVKNLKGDETVDAALAAHIRALWSDPGVLEAYSNRSEFQLTDSANYFFDCIEEIGADTYIPDEQHVLRSRVRTTGEETRAN